MLLQFAVSKPSYVRMKSTCPVGEHNVANNNDCFQLKYSGN